MNGVIMVSLSDINEIMMSLIPHTMWSVWPEAGNATEVALNSVRSL